MKITQILKPESILPHLSGTDVEGVLRELCAPLARSLTRSVEELVQVLQEREQLGSTAVGDGVAFPHGKLAGLPGVVAGLGRAPQGVAFHAPDGKPVTLFVALLAPPEAAAAHLNALARLAKVFKKTSVRAALLEADGAADLYRILSEADARP